MAKKKGQDAKAVAKAAKKAKAAQKVERKDKKKAKDKGDDEDDLEGILDKLQREWEEAHLVTEELVEGPPSKRANATLTACPNGNHLWCIGGEFFSDDGKAYFYNDVFRYSPDKDEWRKFVSPTCPGPRSAHAVIASPTGGGKLFLFGGEFSSLHQTSFHHYRDFWCFDIATHSWERIDTKIRPTARSGHRLAIWKHFIVLFGGFFDPGVTTRYLNDLWIFDTQEYKWRLIEFKPNVSRPTPRSGFSFLSTPDGIVLHGGYCKEYVKGKRAVGVMLEDTWFLHMELANAQSSKADPVTCKWERRKRPSTAYAPALRSGATMALWPTRGAGVQFGGVTDEDTDEETMRSVFWNDLNAYLWAGKGRWVSLVLKRPKKPGGRRKKVALAAAQVAHGGGGGDDDWVDNDGAETATVVADEVDPDDPSLTYPMPRYNAMLAVLRNTLYIYGGIYERGKRQYTLDDFYALQLDKMERFVCLKATDVVITEGGESSSSESEEGDEDTDEDTEDDLDDEDVTVVDPQEALEYVKDKDFDDIAEEDEALVDEVNPEVAILPPLEALELHEEIWTIPEEQPQELHPSPIIPASQSAAPAATAPRFSKAPRFSAEPAPQNTTTAPTPPPAPTAAAAAPATPRAGKARRRAAARAAPDATTLREQAAALLSDAAPRSAEDVLSTPLPGETLTAFYARSRQYWAQQAHAATGASDVRGKELRRDGFARASARYQEYKPVLAEVEKILAEAGLDEEEMRQGAAGAGGSSSGSRNRR